MSYTALRNGSYPSLADIAREETEGGRLVVRFLMSAMQGDLQHAKPCHQLDAARQLLKLGSDDARLYVAENGLGSSSNRNNRNNGSNNHIDPNGSNGAKPPLDQDLAGFIRLQTEGGRAAVRFLVDVMQGSLQGFKPHHRLAAAKELLWHCRNDQPARNDEPLGNDEAAGNDNCKCRYPCGDCNCVDCGDECRCDCHDCYDYCRDGCSSDYCRCHCHRSGDNCKCHCHDDDDNDDGYDGGDQETAATTKDDPAPKLADLERGREQTGAAEPARTQPGNETAEPPTDRNDDSQESNAPQQSDSPRQDDEEVPWYDRPPVPLITMEEYDASRKVQQDAGSEEPLPEPSIESSHYEREAMRKGVDIWRDPADSWISADVNPSSYRPSSRIDSTAFPRGP